MSIITLHIVHGVINTIVDIGNGRDVKGGEIMKKAVIILSILLSCTILLLGWNVFSEVWYNHLLEEAVDNIGMPGEGVYASFGSIEELKKAFGVKNVSLSIYKDDVIVALYGMKNFFEVGSIFTPLTSEKMINDLYGQFISILLFVLYIKQFFDKDKTPAIN